MRVSSFIFLVLWVLSFQLFAQNDDIVRLEKKLRGKRDTARVNVLNELSSKYASSDLKHADSLANEAFALLEKLDYPEGRIRNYLHHSYIKISLGKYDVAAGYIEKAIQISEQIGNKELLADSYNYLFILHFHQGDNEQALQATRMALEFAEEAESKKAIAKSYGNLGIMSGIKGQHTEAIEYFMKSLDNYEKLGDEANSSLAMMHIGHTFELAGNYKKALEYLTRFLETMQGVENKHNEGWTLVNIGVVYSRLNKMDTALTYYHKALDIAEQINNQRLILTCLDNIGGKYTLKGDFENANHYLQRAYKMSEASGQNSRTVYITGNLAENYLYMGQFDSARIFGEQQLELAIKSDLISEQKVAYYNLSQIYDSLKDYENAYQSLHKYTSVNDSIFNNEKSQQIETLREQYEAEKKEQEIKSLMTVNENSMLKNRSYAAAAITFLVMGTLLFYVQRLRAKRNLILLEKEQEVDRMKSRFFANISHEFRTPLTLISGPISEMLSQSKDPAEKRKFSVMKRNTDRLLELINQLLELSKIESGSMKLKVSRSDIISVIKGVALSFHSIAEQKEIDLVLDISPDTLEINFDRSKLETVLTNLLSNAFKFTPQNGQITVKSKLINKKVKKGDREYLEISVEDTGGGIPEHEVQNIFDRFYQSDTNQLLQQEGSGIGLALSKELVELHEGSIKAESQVDRGTQIIFEIPTDLQFDESAFEESPDIQKTRPAPEGSFENDIGVEEGVQTSDSMPLVLVVEDHQEVQNYIREVLKENFTFISASNGEEGVTKAIETIPDLIISDVMMPKKNGYQVCKELKSDERTSHIPIILLTAKAGSEDKIEGLQTQADDYVTKPFVPAELLVRVENLIESRKLLRKKYKKESTIKPSDIAENSIDEKFLTKLIGIVESQLDNERFGVEQLSEDIGMSRSQLHRKLTALIGQGPNQFIRSFRLNRAHDLLKQKAATASEIAYRVGFGSPSYFTKCFQEQFGYAPSDLHKYFSESN